MMKYETNNKYLMHFNKNHDKLGRFAKGSGTKSSGSKNNVRKNLSKYSNDDLSKMSTRLELENRYLNASSRNDSFNKPPQKYKAPKKVLKAIANIGGKTLTTVAGGLVMLLAVNYLEQTGVIKGHDDKAILLKFMKK